MEYCVNRSKSVNFKRFKKVPNLLKAKAFFSPTAFSSKISYWLYDDTIHPAIVFTVLVYYIMIQLLERECISIPALYMYILFVVFNKNL